MKKKRNAEFWLVFCVACLLINFFGIQSDRAGWEVGLRLLGIVCSVLAVVGWSVIVVSDEKGRT